MIADIFSRLPQRVVFKFKLEQMRAEGRNEDIRVLRFMAFLNNWMNRLKSRNTQEEVGSLTVGMSGRRQGCHQDSREDLESRRKDGLRGEFQLCGGEHTIRVCVALKRLSVEIQMEIAGWQSQEGRSKGHDGEFKVINCAGMIRK